MREPIDFKLMYEEHEEFGATSKGLAIPDEQDHLDRMKLAEDALSSLEFDSLLDIGCGFGDLSERISINVQYVGVDYTRWIIETAHERHPHHQFIHGEIKDLPPQDVDVVAALGVISTMNKEDVPAFIEDIKKFNPKYLLISFQLEDAYEGSLNSYSKAEISELVGTAQTWNETANGEITMLYKLCQ